jgi:hypothetical protein
MLTRLLTTIFLALGLAMVWLGFFYHHELQRKAVVEQEAGEEPFFEELEFYTLADDQYTESDDALSGVELSPLHITDFSIYVFPEDQVLHESSESLEKSPESTKSAMEALAEKESDLLEEGAVENFPLILAMSGALFMAFGIFSCKVSELKQAEILHL